MCIIVSKALGVEFPSKKILKRCFNNNPDGAGYMFQADGKVYIRKGFMTWKAFWEDLNSTRKIAGDEAPYVMHFRISTQAGVNAQCTHPYPLSDDMNELKKLSTITDIGIAHNGVIYLTSASWEKTFNDTMKFITDYASLIITDKKYYKDSNKMKLIDRLIGNSRLAILDGTGHIEYIGDGWNADEKGVQYSNTTWKTEKSFFGSSGCYSGNYWDYKHSSPSTTGKATYSSKWEDDDKQDDLLNSYDKQAWYGSGARWEDDYDYYEDTYDYTTGLYNLSPDHCPNMKYGDDGYCDACVNKGYCYFSERLVDTAKTDYELCKKEEKKDTLSSDLDYDKYH